MAKQVGPLFITGTIDGVIFYKLNGQYLMRSKGDYRSGKQMRKDPCLKRTMANADQFGVASKIVKYTYYRYLPPEVRKWGLYGELTGRVKRWLQAGKSKEEAEALLIAYMKTLVPADIYMDTTTQTEATLKNASLHEKRLPVAVITTPAPAPVSMHKHSPKKARYLSRWKVKRNGRLHIPKPQKITLPAKTAVCLSAVELNVKMLLTSTAVVTTS